MRQPLFLHTGSRHFRIHESKISLGGSFVSSVLFAVNRPCYIPFSVPWSYPIKRFFIVNSSTNIAGNIDMGVYTLGGAKLVSTGSVARGAALTAQYYSVNYLLPQGSYYFGVVCNTTSGNGAVGYFAGRAEQQGIYSEVAGTTFPLPAIMNPVGCGSPTPLVPWAGFTYTESGF